MQDQKNNSFLNKMMLSLASAFLASNMATASAAEAGDEAPNARREMAAQAAAKRISNATPAQTSNRIGPGQKVYKDVMLITDKSLCTTFDVSYTYERTSNNLDPISSERAAIARVENIIYSAFNQFYNAQDPRWFLPVDVNPQALTYIAKQVADVEKQDVAVKNIMFENKKTFNNCGDKQIKNSGFVTLINKGMDINTTNKGPIQVIKAPRTGSDGLGL